MSKNKKKYIDLHKSDPMDDDIYIELPCTPVKWTTYHFDCKDDEEIAIDIGTGKASVRKKRDD